MSLPACLGILLLAALLIAQPTLAWVEGQHPVDKGAVDLDNWQTAERAASGVRETIEAMGDEYVKLCKQNNMEGAMSFAHDQLILMPQGYGTISGKTDAIPYFKWVEDVQGMTEVSKELKPLDSSATYVFQRLESTITYKSDRPTFTGKFLRIWKKVDDSYQVYINMYNTGQ
ncbi:uncharacterized protein LOC110978028 [Acanthaster planci]|uniref:Uncharacterized protein LOC110978028 n=1 Tax=Acanthaster planci TaxID=133434 RepID=A0A8B7Y7N7_ACAPL|nr:uncharacterized protein LOC110978028 [Acanthaster planci]